MSIPKITNAFLFCAVVHAIASIPLVADQPAGVERTFAVLVPLPEFAPDFVSEDSQAVVVSGTQPLDTIWFAASGLDPLFQQPTIWEVRDSKHIVRGDGVQDILGVFAWLTTDTVGPPPTGSITLTGNGSPFILDVKYFWFESGYSPGELLIRDTPGGAGFMVVVTAIFSQ